MNKKTKILISLIFVFIFLSGFLLGAYGKKSAVASNEREIYEYLRTFTDVIDIVKKNYVEEVKDKDIVYSAIKGVLESLDPHSSFMPPDVYKEMQTDTKGEFGGIGIEISVKDGFPVVITPIEDTPAYKAGIRSGDHIVKIEGKPTKGMNLMDVVKIIRGQKGKPVVLTIVRDGVPGMQDYTVVRDIIQVKSVKYKMLDSDYGYIRIVQFQEKTSRDLDGAFKELEKMNKDKPLKGIVLDLRNDPGGLLEQAVEVSDKFLSEGAIVSIEGRGDRDGKRSKRVFSATKKSSDYLSPIVVLINEGSASASEIVAGALQDYKRAIVVGTKSFGKGSVQTILPLGDGSALRLTTQKYYTPKGRSIQGEGVAPDIMVENNMVRTKDKIVPLKEKDLIDAKANKNSDALPKKPEEFDIKTLEDDDFQLHMAYQMLKSWEAIRGRNN